MQINMVCKYDMKSKSEWKWRNDGIISNVNMKINLQENMTGGWKLSENEGVTECYQIRIWKVNDLSIW